MLKLSSKVLGVFCGPFPVLVSLVHQDSIESYKQMYTFWGVVETEPRWG